MMQNILVKIDEIIKELNLSREHSDNARSLLDRLQTHIIKDCALHEPIPQPEQKKGGVMCDCIANENKKLKQLVLIPAKDCCKGCYFENEQVGTQCYESTDLCTATSLLSSLCGQGEQNMIFIVKESN